MDFFRLAQNLDVTKWEQLIKRAFPQPHLTPAAARTLNHWRSGRPLPDHRQLRFRRTRNTWHTPASRVPVNACPVCLEQFPTLQALQHHYRLTHAITDPALTTFSSYQCSECRKTFTTPHARLNHECRILYAVPDADNTDLFGWKPFTLPKLTRSPKHGNFTQMALSTPGPHKTQDGEWRSTVAKTTPTVIASAHCTPLFASTNKRINAS